ncbi:hypothetical protein ABI_03860 [Asticcacaulis biprosthecium C19]|uniref:Uncharacterized protein n=1 Tax=Asticcacaulis biprosthecium C19 TaxID=715226 RepID=F4QJK3_9CAUL|nr:hypothetical protein [Asticcacaulis biprosthecium]EGF91954.1 hypothetical protein ABI_03860 [Asticcacaulis biprosthecium C19]
MRLFAGLAAVAVLMTASPILAQTAYEVVPAPAANRGQVVDIAGVRTFTAEDGTYTMTLGPDDTTEVNRGMRFFTSGTKDESRFVDAMVATDRIEDGSEVLVLDTAQDNIADTPPPFLGDLTVTERKVITLGSGNGKKPARLAIWIATDPQAPGTVTIVGGALLPKGSLMVLIDCNTAAEAEAFLRNHLRLAEGVFE